MSNVIKKCLNKRGKAYLLGILFLVINPLLQYFTTTDPQKRRALAAGIAAMVCMIITCMLAIILSKRIEARRSHKGS